MGEKGKINGVTAAVMVMAFPAMAWAGGRDGGNSLAVWLFFGFCALIVLGQLFPTIFTLWGAKRALGRQLAKTLPGSDDPQETPVGSSNK
ncbi:MAG TPA: hypothetical protein VHN12_09545 [Geobacteraceae bacterium]|nr:hypothetical protein [Geobacteraceae bacterium]